MNYYKKVLFLIIVSTVARLLIASLIDLTNDEVYYWTYALYLQWNYFDHPPLVGWLIRLTTANLWLHHEAFVRLGAIASSAMCTFIIYKIASIVKSDRAGWYAALLYTASVYGSIIAGTLILPDSPQMAFWLWSILLLIKISKLLPESKEAKKLWIWFGITSGLCIMSKIHGVFLWAAAGLYISFLEPKSFKNPGIYLAAFICLIIISPIIAWNIQNHFITYTYHGGRVSLGNATIQADSFIREVSGEVLYNNPVNFFLIWSALLAAFKGKLQANKKEITVLLFCGLPLIAVLLIVSVFRETLPHWSGPAYSCLVILAAIKLATNTQDNYIPPVVKAALTLVTVLAFAGILLINLFPGTLSPDKEGPDIGDGDFTLELYGWRDAGKKIDSLYKSDVSQNIMPKHSPIIVNKWFPAAHIDFYVASLTGQNTIGIGNIFDLHQYYWTNKYKQPLKQGDAAYLIVASNYYAPETIDLVKKNFDTVSLAAVFPQYRSGSVCRNFYVYRLKGYHL